MPEAMHPVLNKPFGLDAALQESGPTGLIFLAEL
jgi:hypothetical protein